MVFLFIYSFFISTASYIRHRKQFLLSVLSGSKEIKDNFRNITHDVFPQKRHILERPIRART